MARRFRVLAVVAGFVLAATAGLPADAHPFGAPQTATIAGTTSAPEVTWRFGATDDIAYLAVQVGALPPDRMTLDGVVLYESGDETALARSEAYADYVLDHILIEGCDGSVEPGEDLIADGTTVTFDCPSPTSSTRIEIDMLTDLHPAYQTLASGPNGQKAAYAGDARSHGWSLDESRAAATGLSALVQLGGTLGVLALAGVAAWWLVRRRRSAGTSASAS
ncbi:PE-PGRS family protein [Nocardioidaceae bacterium Broad-1]|nr:PE-PGRS family protein [Nocardioidaceae bacterium Broad-1]